LLRMKALFVIAFALLVGVAVQASAPIRVSKIPSFRWDQFVGKVVLVTGGSSGIGYGTALYFARYGARVIITSRDSRPDWFNGSDAARRINEDPDVISLGGYARWVKTDMSLPEEVDALMKNITGTEGTIDFAVNNAGIAGFIGPLYSEDLEATLHGVHDTIRNTLFSTVYSMAAELKLWDEQNRGGAIVNTASVNGYHGTGDAPLYCAAKHGVIGLTKSVALEYPKAAFPIRINAIAPGFTDTSLVWQQCKLLEGTEQSWEGDYITHDHPLWKKYGHYYAEAAPSGKLCSPEDQARMIMYLCSEEAKYISGAVMIVDAGVNDEGTDVQ